MAIYCRKFPSQVSQPTFKGAKKSQICIARARECLGVVLNYFGIPGPIADVTIIDRLTGQVIEIKCGVLYTKLSVDGRDYLL